MNVSRKYRFAMVVLATLSLTTLAGIAGVVVWRDYDAHGTVSLSRAFVGIYANFADVENPGGRSTAAPGYDSSAGGLPVIATGEPGSVQGKLPELRQQMLYLINTERVRARVAPLTLSDSPAAQNHAESMMEYGFRSHWDIGGLTPQMRYTLSGGTQRVLQNIAGPVALAENGQGESVNLANEISQVHRRIMSGAEEAANVLDPWHRRVSFGFACRQERCWVVQQFETNHINFETLPAIRQGMLSLSGEMQDGVVLDSVALWYHSYPRPLSLGQLDATYNYGYGQRPATFIRPRLLQESYYPNAQVNYGWRSGIDPYTLEPILGRSAAPPLMVEVAQSAAVPWTTAKNWEQDGSYFDVSADVTEVLRNEGSGVYIVQIWGRQGQERTPLSNYAIFVR